MKSRFLKHLILCSALSGLLIADSGRADTLSATGGLAFGRSSGFDDVKVPAPTFGAEYTFDLGSHVQLGGFIDHELLQFTASTAGSLNFMGGVVRYNFNDNEKSGPFIYGKAGMGSMSNNTENSSQRLCFGDGLGYQIALNSHLSVSPRMGVSFLPDSTDSSNSNEARYEGGMMISFHF